MFENNANNSSNSSDERGGSYAEYLSSAASACAAGDAELAMHLYLTAFERARREDGALAPEAALNGLKQAWALACSLKERSMAEYVFERLEPYLTSDEIAECARELQDLALDKLEEYGLSRADLEDMTDMISNDLLGLEGARVVRLEHVAGPLHLPSRASERSDADADAPAVPDMPIDVPEVHLSAKALQAAPDAPDTPALDRLTYRELPGYHETVAIMRDFGVGMQHDEAFQTLVKQLNARHGLDRMPASDAMLFRSPAREDASRFAAATVGELDLPAVRMRMEENLQGMPVLCVMAQADRQPRLNGARNAFEGPGVLVLEDLDLWVAPMAEPMSDDFNGFLFASLSRGAREAVNLIRSAVENPDVYVLASAAEAGEIDPFFCELLEPLTIIDIDYPTEAERADIWMDIAREHPSLRSIDRSLLVRYSAHMPRYDLYMAAREAVEEAYKASLVARRYIPVTSDNLFDKLAAYQPLDSAEYRALEEAVLSDFRAEIDRMEDALASGEEE